jgi:hypothetical protein
LLVRASLRLREPEHNLFATLTMSSRIELLTDIASAVARAELTPPAPGEGFLR